MPSSKLPALWLIVIIVGLPLLSETVYSPSLPAIAHALAVPEAWVEYTLTIYLAGFSVGTLIWGKISDKHGRKPTICLGYFIYILGCIGCLLSNNITLLLISRFVQAFGGSVGSVIGQAIARDVFTGKTLSKVYTSVSTALAIFPAIGPVIGGTLTEHFGWYMNFIFLLTCGVLLLITITLKLPETHPKESRIHVSVLSLLRRMIGDNKLISLGILTGISNGINFTYFAEGSFYLIQMLGLSPSNFGLTFIGIAVANLLGGIITSKLQNKHTALIIINHGVNISVLGSALATSVILIQPILHLSNMAIIITTLLSIAIMTIGSCLIRIIALSIALENYRDATGTASSIFGSFYYSLISAVTFGMGLIHSHHSLLRMPAYFLGISIIMLVIIRRIMPEKQSYIFY